MTNEFEYLPRNVRFSKYGMSILIWCCLQLSCKLNLDRTVYTVFRNIRYSSKSSNVLNTVFLKQNISMVSYPRQNSNFSFEIHFFKFDIQVSVLHNFFLFYTQFFVIYIQLFPFYTQLFFHSTSSILLRPASEHQRASWEHPNLRYGRKNCVQHNGSTPFPAVMCSQHPLRAHFIRIWNS